jgi:type III secretion protein W
MTGDIHTSQIQQTHLQSQQILPSSLLEIYQEESDAKFQQWADEASFSPTLIARKFEQLELKTRRQARKEEADKAERKEEGEHLVVQEVQAISEQFERKNPELEARPLQLLRARIKLQDTKEEILEKVLEMYPDFSLADEALEFLLRTTKGELSVKVGLARATLNETYGREVRAGRNMAEQAREFSSKGLGTPTGLRGLYRDITGNPRDSNTLFNELSSKFEYDKMKTLISFLLHALGSDLKSKGPSIDHAELHRLITETRKLQAILGIFRFFKGRMALIAAAFARAGISLPAGLSFEALAKLFMKFLQERYPAPEKVLQLAIQLGLAEEWLGQIIIFTQMRDGIRGVAPKLFKSEQHRQDVLKSYIDAIEDLDERLEEEDDQEKKEKEKRKKKDEK